MSKKELHVEENRVANLSPDYRPSKKEKYMCNLHLEYFRRKLKDWKNKLLHESVETIHHMQEESQNEPDPSDQASNETNRSLELRTRDRERKLINKINAALIRVQDKSYGYCEETGEKIGLIRLESRPIATLCLEAQETRERQEKIFRDD